MSESILYICRGTTSGLKAIENEVESWKVDHQHATLARDVEDWVRACLLIPEQVRRVQSLARRKLFANEIHDVSAVDEAMQNLFDAALGVCRVVGEDVRKVTALGYAVENAADLSRAAEEIGRMRAEFSRGWPRIDPAMWAKTEAQYEAGAYQSAGEILHELQNPDRA